MIEAPDIRERIRIFKGDLATLSPLQVIRKHIIYGSCAVISGQQYFDLRSEIAEKCQVHPNEVMVVESAKLGFSIAPNNHVCDRAYGALFLIGVTRPYRNLHFFAMKSI